MAVDTQISAKGSRGHHTFYLKVTETGYDIATNTSTISFDFWLVDDNNWYWSTQGTKVSYRIDIGEHYWSGYIPHHTSKTTDVRSESGISFTHNSDGALTIPISFKVTDSSGISYLPGNASTSGTLVCTTIPRASDIALGVSSFSITSASGNAFSWSITAKSNSFYNRLRYTLGSTSWSGNVGQGSHSGYFTNPDLLNCLPTATSGSLTVYCDTYSDSGYSNLIGTKSVVIAVSVNTSYIKPSVSLGNIVINSTPITGYAVAGYSTLRDTFSTSNSYGASSVTTYFSISTGSLTGTSTTVTSGTIYTNTLPQSTSNYTLYIYAYAKDSRGAVGTTVSKSITVYGYQPPTATLKAYRTSSSSSTSEDGAGTYAYVTFSGAVRSSVNSQNSIQSTVCKYSGSISGTATNGGHYALADTQSVTFKLTVKDKVTSSTASVTIPTARYPLDLYDDGNGNVGFGAGAVATAGAFNVGGMRMYVNDTAPVIAVKNEQYQIGQHIGGDGSTRGVWDWGGDVASGRNNWVYYLDNNNSFYINGGADGVVNMNGILRVNTIYSPSIARFYDTSTVLREGAYAIGADTLSYTAPQDCVCVLTANITANSNGICTIKINGVTLADMQTHRQSEFMNIIPIYLAKGDGLEIYISSKSSSSYKIFGLKY